METAATMKATTVKTSHAGESTVGVAPDYAAVIDPAKRATVSACLSMWSRRIARATAECASGMKIATAVMSYVTGTIHVVVVVNDSPAMEHIGIVVKNQPVVVPIWMPMMPAPAIPTKETNSEARSEGDPR